MYTSKITGTGCFLPPSVVDNALLCKFYPGKGPIWITKKLGIEERRFGFDFESQTMRDGLFDDDLAHKAATAALKMAGTPASKLDIIIRVTCTPEYLFFPDAACILHDRIGASRDCAAFTIPAGCGGLIYALKLADDQIRSGSIKKALIVASNTPSSFINFHDQELVEQNWLNISIFGDGASAIVVEGPESSGAEILAAYVGAWHKNDPVMYPAGGSRNPTSLDNIKQHYYRLDAIAVEKFAHEHFQYALKRLMKKHPFSTEDIAWFLFHQPNLRILQRLSQMLEIPMSKILVNVDVYGNTSAASIGILLDEAVWAEKIKRDELLVLAAVGAGWQYGALLVKW